MPEGNKNQLITDLHAHSRVIASFLPPEGITYTPTDLVERASRLDIGIAHTPHDTIAGTEEALIAGADLGVIVTPGVEITSRKGPRIPHILALFPTMVALDLEHSDTKIPFLRGPKYVMDWIHGHDGVAIAAHPKPKGDNVSLSFKKIVKLTPWLDGVEIETRCKARQTRKIKETVEHLGLAAIGSSDAHDLNHIGVAATLVTGLPEHIVSDDVIQAIRDRRTAAVVLREASEKHMIEGPLASQIRRYRQVVTSRKQDRKKQKVKSGVA